MCPKALPDQVIVHRIEFQESEREIIRDLAMAYQINKVADPIVRLVNDNTTMLLILSAAAAWIGFTYIPPKIEEGINLVEDFREQLEHAVAEGTILRRAAEDLYAEGERRVTTVGEAAMRGPLWGGIDLLEALLGRNLPDFGGGYEP